MATTDNDSAFTASDALIVALYAFGIGLNVYLILDTMTDGELTRKLSVTIRNFVGKAGYRRQQEEDIKRASAHVVFEAINIVETGDSDNEHD